MTKKNQTKIYSWAVQEFFEGCGWDRDCDEKLEFINRHDEQKRFEFPEITPDETEISLTNKVIDVLQEFGWDDSLFSDWNLLLERFRILDGSEDLPVDKSEDSEEDAGAPAMAA